MEKKRIIPGSREDRRMWEMEEADRRRYTPRILPPLPDAILEYYITRDNELKKATEILTERMRKREELRIAIQKNGRLTALSLNLVEAAMRAANIPLTKEIREEWRKNRKMVLSPDALQTLKIISVRQADIPWYIESGNADYGIVGEDLLVEKEPTVTALARLGEEEISLVIAVSKNSKIRKMRDLNGKIVATSFPNTLKKELARRKIEPKTITVLRGSVETALVTGLADAICDLTKTGETLAANNLRQLETIRDYEPILIGKASGVRGL